MKNLVLNVVYFFYQKFKNREKEFEKRYYREKFNSKFPDHKLYNAINGKFEITEYSGLILGENVHLGDGLYIETKGGVTIGDHSHISRNVSIYSTNHNYEGQRLPYDDKLVVKPVHIGKYVWIGRNVNILPGVTIGNGAIIAMGSTISKNVRPGEIVGSSKQFIIGSRNRVDVDFLESDFKFGGPSGKGMSNKQLSYLKDKDRIKNKLVFVLSTGRSGSATIVDYLNKSEEVSAYHEAFYVILKSLSLRYLTGKINKDQVKEELSNLIDNFYRYDQSFVIHSDQKLVPFINILSELYPDAKFIWLIRHPKSFLKSVVSRGWYDNDDPIPHKDTFLLNLNHRSHGLRVSGDLVGEYPENEWSSMNIFQRNLWYWKYWNGLIAEQFKSLPSNKKLVIKLEDFDQSLKEIHDFIGIKSEVKETVKSNSVKKKDKRKFESLTSEIDQHFNSNYPMVKNSMKEWGY